MPTTSTADDHILRSGRQRLHERDLSVHVPPSDEALPVVILLHGRGGAGQQILASFTNDEVLAPLTASHILVAPAMAK